MPKVNLYIPETAYEILIRYKSNTGEKRQQIFGKSAIKRMKKKEFEDCLPSLAEIAAIEYKIDNKFQRNGEITR